MSLRVPLPPGRALRVDPAIVAIIAAATTDGQTLTLSGQLAPDLYRRVDKILVAAGGRWDRRRGAHVFADGDAALAIEPILVNGTLRLPPDLGWFPTPPALAAELVRRAGVRRGLRVLEPSAGEGAIVRALLDVGADVIAVECDPKRHAVLNALMGDPVWARCRTWDFLTIAAEPDFDAVVMNPPFAPRGTDVEHVSHAMRFLAPGGRLVAVMSAGTTFRADRRTSDFRDLVHGLGGTIEPLPDGSFRASGTDVRTVLVTVIKPKGKPHG